LNTYQGLHARFYDLIYADKPYGAEAQFVVDQLLQGGVEGRALLDVACGSGRHARELQALGFDVTGVDYSPDLLAMARERSGGIEFVEQDMRELDLGARRFAAATCLFDSIGYPQTDEGVIATLRGIGRHLARAGVAAIEFLHAPAVLSHSSPVRVRRWETPGGGTLLRVSETELDRERNVMHVDYDVVHLAPDGTWEREREEQSNRFFDVEEMRDLMTRAGFSDVRFVAAYQSDDKIRTETFHVMAVAQ